MNQRGQANHSGQAKHNEPWLLDLQGLTVAYDGQVVLNKLKLQLQVGESIAIVGHSGSGKTTLLRTLLGLLPSHSQMNYEVASFDGIPWPTSEKLWHTLRGRAIVYVPQEAQASLSPVKTIEAQCRDVAKVLHLSWGEAQERIHHILPQLDLPSTVLQQRPSELSGGMAQRVVMLLALLPQPKLIVADEPTANLDVVRQQQMVALLRQVQAQSGAALVFVTHQLELAVHLSHTIYEMKEGQLEKREVKENLLKTSRINPCSENINLENANSIKRSAAKTFAVPPKITSLSEPPLLAVTDVSVAYEETEPVLQNVSLRLGAGEWIALMGLSGAGKSTFFNTLLGLQPVQQGLITYGGTPLQAFTKAELGQIVQPILQNPQSSFNPRQTIGWSMGEALRSQTRRSCSKGWHSFCNEGSFSAGSDTSSWTGDTIVSKVANLLAQVQLPKSYAKRYPHELSGGECQRVALARALSSEPHLLLCDEITSALDPAVRLEIMQVLQNLRQQRHLAGLVITHDLQVATMLCDDIYVLESGQIVERASASELVKKPQSKTAQRLVQAYANWQDLGK